MMNAFRVDTKSQNLFRWIEWIVSSNLPFSFVENELTRVNTANTRTNISRTTLMKYMDQIGYKIEGMLSAILPDRFGLAFDGNNTNGNNTNYCGVFVMWYDDKRKCDRVYLLRLAPLLRSDDYGADSHIKTLTSFLARVGKTMENVVVICGDNCETNLAIARRSGIHFIGCHSHRLNLGVKLFLLPDEHIMDKVSKLMVALLTKKNCGRLRAQGCITMPVRRFIIRYKVHLISTAMHCNGIELILIYFPHRWNGTYVMLERYLKIRGYLNTGEWPNIMPILELIPSLAEDARFRVIFAELKGFESVSKGLQRADSTLFAARTGLNWLLNKHPHLAPKLGTDFCDYLWRDFESAVVKVRLHVQKHLLLVTVRLTVLFMSVRYSPVVNLS